MPSSRLKGGVLGCGYFAQSHLEAWRRMPDVEIVAACDIELKRAREAAPHAYSSLSGMLEREQLDFLDIVTRPDTHLPFVRLAAAHRVPIICQKPMAPSWTEAAAMVAAAESAGVPLMIHENWRWQPWYRVAEGMIRNGEIGRPVGYRFLTRKRDGFGDEPYPSQPYFRQMPRLLIYEVLVHHIDTARFLFGDITSIYAQARRRNLRIVGEDQALLALTHGDSLPGWIDGHRFLDPDPDGPAMGEACFEGENGSVRILATGDVYRNGTKVWTNEIHEGYRGDSVFATQKHFISCLREGRPFESGGREYLEKTFAVVEAAYRSVAEKRSVSPKEMKS